jgi:DNA-binding GntR family transcriptional regulator
MRHATAARAPIRAGDAGQRSYLLGDFHVCLAECAGYALRAEILRDLTARTTLIATLFQSTHDASRSCDDHARIVDALEAGDIPLATRLVRQHIATVVQHLGTPPPARDALSQLRSALESPRPEPPTPSPRRGLFTDLVPPAPARPPNRAPRRRSLER